MTATPKLIGVGWRSVDQTRITNPVTTTARRARLKSITPAAKDAGAMELHSSGGGPTLASTTG